MPIKLKLDQLNNKRDLTVIITVYALNLASQHCQRLLLLNQDQLITNGDPIGVITRKLTISVNLISTSFLIWVDNIARSGLSNTDIPITSAFGRLFFLLIMTRTSNTN